MVLMYCANCGGRNDPIENNVGIYTCAHCGTEISKDGRILLGQMSSEVKGEDGIFLEPIVFDPF
jgi:DNA-directed RNA polymerase subunit RPC12/RpoP